MQDAIQTFAYLDFLFLWEVCMEDPILLGEEEKEAQPLSTVPFWWRTHHKTMAECSAVRCKIFLSGNVIATCTDIIIRMGMNTS